MFRLKNDKIYVNLTVTSDGLTSLELEDDGKAFDPFEVGTPDLESSVEDRPVGGWGFIS